MRDFQRKRKIRKALYSKGVLFIVFLLLILAAKATWGVYSKEHQSESALKRVESELAALEAREETLTANISRLKTPEGVEWQIREQFQVAKPGERMVVLIDEKGKVESEEVQERSLLSKFFDLFRRTE